MFFLLNIAIALLFSKLFCFVLHDNQDYHRTTPKNKLAAVRLPKNQILFIVKPLKVVEDQKKRSSRPQSPVFPLKIGEKKSSRPQNPMFLAKISKISTELKNKHVS